MAKGRLEHAQKEEGRQRAEERDDIGDGIVGLGASGREEGANALVELADVEELVAVVAQVGVTVIVHRDGELEHRVEGGDPKAFDEPSLQLDAGQPQATLVGTQGRLQAVNASLDQLDSFLATEDGRGCKGVLLQDRQEGLEGRSLEEVRSVKWLEG